MTGEHGADPDIGEHSLLGPPPEGVAGVGLEVGEADHVIAGQDDHYFPGRVTGPHISCLVNFLFIFCILLKEDVMFSP